MTSSVIAILAQRLVRVICKECKEEYIENQESLREIGIDADAASNIKTFRGRGCPSCLETGYMGRTGLFELLVLDDRVKDLILQTSDANRIRSCAALKGMTTLRQAGAQKVLEGITTIEEILRVTRQ